MKTVAHCYVSTKTEKGTHNTKHWIGYQTLVPTPAENAKWFSLLEDTLAASSETQQALSSQSHVYLKIHIQTFVL